MSPTANVPLDIMAIDSERRQTRPLAINILFGGELNNLNDDYIRVASLEGQEGVSQPYQFNIEVRADDDTPESAAELDGALKFVRPEPGGLAQGYGSDIIGKWANLRVAMPYNQDRFTHLPLDADPDWENTTPSRFFGGIITSVTHGTPGSYQLQMQSPLYPSTLRNRYHIYRNKNLKDLITTVLTQELTNYSAYFSIDLTNVTGLTAGREQDWFQAGESDFAFLQRVIAKASVHFYFIHDCNRVTLVFSNKTTQRHEVNIPGTNGQMLALRYSYTTANGLGLQQDDLFTDLKYEVKMVQKAVRTVLTHQESVWTTNKVASYSSYDAKSNDAQLPIEYQRHRCYAYGTDADETQSQFTKVCQQLATEEGTLSGTSTSPLLSPGYTFELSQPVVSSLEVTGRMPAQFDGQVFVVTQISHKASDGQPYTGSVQATQVNLEADEYTETLITPFDMQSTQQGSVLATVLETAVPKDWRYRDKSNFHTENSSVKFNNQSQKEIGCIVKFATDDPNDSTTHWVALSSGSQTAPEVHSTVMIGRGSNESEIPEIQQVVSSHGQKTIMPPDRRSNHWTANSSWGSNYSASYGDSISVRYDNEASVNLQESTQIVEDAYDNPGVLSTNYGSSSYNKGSSISFSTTEDGKDGLASASVSEGSSFGESHTGQSYNVSYVGKSQSFSKVNKSVSVSYMGTFDDTIDWSSPSFIDGKIPVQSIIDICDSLPDGSSYNQNHVTGKTISLSGTGTEPPSSYDASADVYSHAKTVGKVMSKNYQSGDTISSSETFGNTTSSSFQLGNVTGANMHIGNNLNGSVSIGNAISSNFQLGTATNTSFFLGAKNDIQTNIAATNSLSTNISYANNIAMNISSTFNLSTTIGNSTSVDTTIGNRANVSTSIGNTASVSTNIGSNSSVSTNITANNSVATNIGPSSSVSTNISTNNDTSLTIGAANRTELFIGSKNNTSLSLTSSNNTNLNIGSSNDTSINISASNSTSLNLSASNSTSMNLSASNSTSLNLSASNATNLALSMSNEVSISGSISATTKIHGGVSLNTSIGAPSVDVNLQITAATKSTKMKILAGIECTL